MKISISSASSAGLSPLTIASPASSLPVAADKPARKKRKPYDEDEKAAILEGVKLSGVNRYQLRQGLSVRKAGKRIYDKVKDKLPYRTADDIGNWVMNNKGLLPASSLVPPPQSSSSVVEEPPSKRQRLSEQLTPRDLGADVQLEADI